MLLPMLAGAVAASASACGGNVSSVDDPKTVNANVAGSSGGTSSGGTSGTGSSGGTDVAIDVCDGAEYEMLEGVTATTPVDYMEIRDQFDGSDVEKPLVVARAGTPCASATNKGKCESDLEALRSSAGWRVASFGLERSRQRYLVATIGDQIKTVTSLEALRAFVSPVDTAKDAALLATVAGKYSIQCDGKKHARKTDAGWDLSVVSGHTCGPGTKLEGHVLGVTTTGDITVKETTLLEEGNPSCAIGRRPAGLVARASEDLVRGAVGRFFAEAAHLEAASVVAFERLGEELRALGAPDELVAAAGVSRDDEVRHTRMTSRLARRFGGTFEAPTVTPMNARTAFEIALENAVEGCVRETFGALVAHWQANAACDDAVAATMRVIAADETRHAALAWDVAAWLEPRLEPEERTAVEAARAKAIDALRSELAEEPSADLVAVAGVPQGDHAIALLDMLDQSFLRAA